jgi:hypothetical protein
MPDKVDVTVAIEEYRLEMADYIRKYKQYLIFTVLLPLPGIFFFLKIIKRKKILDARRLEIQQMLKDISTEIPFNDYMDMRKRFITTKTY